MMSFPAFFSRQTFLKYEYAVNQLNYIILKYRISILIRFNKVKKYIYFNSETKNHTRGIQYLFLFFSVSTLI